MRKILRGCVQYVLHPLLLLPLIAFYDRVFAPQLEKAWGLYIKRKIRDCDPTARINGRVVITSPDRISIGRGVRIGRGCFLFTDGGLVIGDGSVLSRNITIYTGNHCVEGDGVPYDNAYSYKPVKIGIGVWIGMNVCITPGVSIGDHAIVGMGAVISRDVPEGAVVGGAPQRTIRVRNVERKKALADQGEFFGTKWPEL